MIQSDIKYFTITFRVHTDNLVFTELTSYIKNVYFKPQNAEQRDKKLAILESGTKIYYTLEFEGSRYVRIITNII